MIQVLEFIESIRIMGLFVMKFDIIIYEEYFNGMVEFMMYIFWLVVKFVVVIFLGIVYYDGLIKDLVEFIIKYLL